MTNLVELTVPDIGDFDQIEIIEVLINIGDTITENQDVITLESDKAAMEIPSIHAGMVKEVKVVVGDKVAQGSVIAVLEKPEIPATKPTTTEPEIVKPEPIKIVDDKIQDTPPKVVTEVGTAQKTICHASPSVRQFARELGANLSLLAGTGPKGRITKLDVQNFVKASINQAPESVVAPNTGIPTIATVDFSNFGETENHDLTRIKKISGKHLHACWLNIPHVTQFDEVDITELETFRKDNKDQAKKQGTNLTPLVFIMKAVAATLKIYPNFNSSLSQDLASLITKKFFNIGVAVDTPNGLMVPVIKNVDKKGFLDLSYELAKISQKARDGQLSPADLQGGSFTISSLGSIGGGFFTPIINAPEVAILGVGRHKTQPVWDGNTFVPRLMLPLALSYDHRVIDGAEGARFITALNQMLADIRKVLL